MPRSLLRGALFDSRDMVMPIVRTMSEIGYIRAFVVHGLDSDGSRGMDEISILGKTKVAELKVDGEIEEYMISAEDFGIKECEESSILYQSDRTREAVQLLRVLSGEDRGPRRDIVCLNVAPILYITGHTSDLEEGVEKARTIIDSGKPIKRLAYWVKEQNSNPKDGMERFEKLHEMAYA